jgi:hypothetical protein
MLRLGSFRQLEIDCKQNVQKRLHFCNRSPDRTVGRKRSMVPNCSQSSLVPPLNELNDWGQLFYIAVNGYTFFNEIAYKMFAAVESGLNRCPSGVSGRGRPKVVYVFTATKIELLGVMKPLVCRFSL